MGLCYTKIHNPQICIWPPSDQPVGGASTSGGPQLKKYKDKKFLEINFNEGVLIFKDLHFLGAVGPNISALPQNSKFGSLFL